MRSRHVAISQLSAVDVSGALLSANGAETGSPGSIATVPEPESYAVALIGLTMLGLARHARQG